MSAGAAHLATLHAKTVGARVRLGEHDRTAEERKREREQRRTLRRDAEAEAAARALLTGVAPAPLPAEPEPDDGAIRAQLVADLEEARRTEREGRIAACPALVQKVEEAVATLIAEYEKLGRVAPEAYARIPALAAAAAEAFSELDTIAGDLGQDPIAARMQAELRRHLRRLVEKPSEEAVIGWVVAAALQWLRNASSPTPSMPERFGPLDGSCIYSAPAIGDPMSLPHVLPVLPGR